MHQLTCTGGVACSPEIVLLVPSCRYFRSGRVVERFCPLTEAAQQQPGEADGGENSEMFGRDANFSPSAGLKHLGGTGTCVRECKDSWCHETMTKHNSR